MNFIIENFLSADFAFAILRVSTPLIWASLAAAISIKSNVINIAIDGIMLVAALVGVIVSGYLQNIYIALLAAILAGVTVAGILGFFSLKLNTNIFIGGIALNMFASGITIFILYLATNDKAASSSLTSQVVPSWNIPVIEDIPIIGQVLSGHNALTYLAFAGIILYYFILFHTKFGLRLRAVGENPEAVNSVGISIFKTKFTAFLLSGFFASLGGIFLSMGYLSFFVKDMTGGRGIMGLAIALMSGGHPLGMFFSSILFGVTMQVVNNIKTLRVPSELVEIIPYVVVIIVLISYGIKEKR
jgi:general nucleoside transport system permease protein